MKGLEKERCLGTFCLLLRPGLVGVEVGECLEIGVESWLLEPVPLAERAHGAGGKRGRSRRGGGKEKKEVNSKWIKKCVTEA